MTTCGHPTHAPGHHRQAPTAVGPSARIGGDPSTGHADAPGSDAPHARGPPRHRGRRDRFRAALPRARDLDGEPSGDRHRGDQAQAPDQGAHDLGRVHRGWRERRRGKARGASRAIPPTRSRPSTRRTPPRQCEQAGEGEQRGPPIRLDEVDVLEPFDIWLVTEEHPPAQLHPDDTGRVRRELDRDGPALVWPLEQPEGRRETTGRSIPSGARDFGSFLGPGGIDTLE